MIITRFDPTTGGMNQIRGYAVCFFSFYLFQIPTAKEAMQQSNGWRIKKDNNDNKRRCSCALILGPTQEKKLSSLSEIRIVIKREVFLLVHAIMGSPFSEYLIF